MAASGSHRDPRSFVTPDAFEVSGDLLGTPLATPGKRLVALLVDLLVIGFVTLVTRSFALVLGFVAGAFFMRAGFKRTPVRGSVFGRAMRFSVGCLGLTIALLTTLVWASCGIGIGFGDGIGRQLDGGATQGEQGVTGQIFGALSTLGLINAFEEAETLEDAETVAAELIEAADELGIAREDVGALLRAQVPPDASWAAGSEEVFARLLGEGADAEAAPTGPSASPAVEAAVAGMSPDEVARAYAAALAGPSDDAEARARLHALERRLVEIVAQDTLGTLGGRIEALERRNLGQRRELEDASDALAEAGSGGVFGWLREFVDELGFGFGWASLYLTVFLSWWNGQTVGKKMMGLRVKRLDGEPITWWVAFERAGGYAAGFATGLLGFAQIYWDANRQAIHDRIVGTVVVVEGADRVTDWESAL